MDIINRSFWFYSYFLISLRVQEELIIAELILIASADIYQISVRGEYIGNRGKSIPHFTNTRAGHAPVL